MRRGFRLSATAILVVLAGCASLEPPVAVQTPYRAGVPHTDSRGGARLSFAAGESFFPIGIYHALGGRHFGRDYDLAALQDAGFNLAHPWEGQDPGAMAAAARVAGLKLMVHDPAPADVRRLAPDPAIWGWYLDEEPSGHYPPDDHAAKLAAFASRRAAIRAVDPGRPVFSLDKPAMDDERRVNWLKWIEASDIAAHFNYPVMASPPLRTLDTARGIPRSVALAVDAARERKPVLVVLQAFASPGRGWAMPTPEQMRAMTFAAIVHGATGIMFFAYDSFVTRDDDVLGIAPDPIADHGPVPDFNADGMPPLTAKADDLRRSRELWRATKALNAELKSLAPDILTPTADVPYEVTVAEDAVSPAPVRTLLKRRDGRFVLLAVNLDDVRVRARMTFAFAVRDLRRMFDDAPPPVPKGGAWEDEFPPFAVRIYTFAP